jgi:hypothetical protein
MALGLICLIIYPIGKKLNLRVQDELAQRRQQFATSVPLEEH